MALAGPVAQRVGWESVASISTTALRLSGDHLPAYIGLMQLSAELLDRLLVHSDRSKALEIFALADKMAEHHPAPAIQFLRNSPDLLMLVGAQGVRSIAEVIDRTIAFGWQDAVRIADDSSDDCRALLRVAQRRHVVAYWDLLQRIAADPNHSVRRLLQKGPALLEVAIRHKQLPALFALLGRLAERNPRIAGRMFELGGALTACFSIDELARLGEVVLEIGAHHADTALDLLQLAPVLIGRLPAEDAHAVLFDLYALAAQAVAESPRLAEQIGAQSPEVITRIGLDGLRGLIGQCRTLGRVSWPAVFNLWGVACDLTDRIGSTGLGDVSRMAVSIAEACPQTAAGFIRHSAGIVDRVGPDGLRAFAAFCGSMAAAGGGMAIRFPEQSLSVMDGLLAQCDRQLVQTVYHAADGLGRRHPMIAYQALEKSPELIAHLGTAGFEDFCDLAADMAHDSWTAANALVKAAPDILDGIGYSGLKALADFSLVIARHDVYGALSLLEKSPAIVERLVRLGGRSLAVDIFRFTTNAASIDRAVAISLLDKSPVIVDRADHAAFEEISGRCLHIAQHSSAAAMALTEAAVVLLETADLHTFLGVADFWTRIAPQCGEQAAGLIQACPTKIAEWIALGGPPLPERIFQLVSDMAAHNAVAALNLLAHSSTHLAAVGLEGLQKIAAQAMLLTPIDPEEAARFAAGESVAFADFIKSMSQGVRLEHVKLVLSNYLTALLGYRLEIVPGSKTAITASKMVLPAKVHEFQSKEQNFIYYKVMATRLGAHLEYGSFDLDVRHTQTLIQFVRDTYGSANQVRDGEAADFYRLFPEPALAGDLAAAFEAYRIDQRLMNEYPALAKQIVRVNRHDLTKQRAPQGIRNPKQQAVAVIARALMMQEPQAISSDASPMARIQAQALARAATLQVSSAGFHNTLAIATEIYFQISERFDRLYRPLDPTRDRIDQQQIHQAIGNFSKTSRSIMQRLHSQEDLQQAVSGGVETQGQATDGKPVPARRAPRQERVPHARHRAEGQRPELPVDAETEDNPTQMSSGQRSESGSSNGMKFFSGERLENLLRTLFKRKGITPNEIEKQIAALRPDEVGLLLQDMAAQVEEKMGLVQQKSTTRYDEWDGPRGHYRRNWCRVRELAAPEASLDFYRQTLGDYGGLLKKVRREFQRMRPEAWSRLSRLPDGDDIDLDAAVENMIDRKAGSVPSDNAYQRTHKHARDIAVAILVDMSKSTKGNTLRFEKEALIILSEALKEVGDAFAIYGFSGDTRDNIDFYRIKDFDEPYQQRVHSKIAGIDYGLENRDGTAVRHTVALMKAREEKFRLVILISDGKPVDKEYAGQYAIEDTRKALLEARKEGVKTFCITVDEKAADYLPRMYSHSNWVVVDDVARLPEKISRIFARLTN